MVKDNSKVQQLQQNDHHHHHHHNNNSNNSKNKKRKKKQEEEGEGEEGTPLHFQVGETVRGELSNFKVHHKFSTMFLMCVNALPHCCQFIESSKKLQLEVPNSSASTSLNVNH